MLRGTAERNQGTAEEATSALDGELARRQAWSRKRQTFSNRKEQQRWRWPKAQARAARGMGSGAERTAAGWPKRECRSLLVGDRWCFVALSSERIE